MMFHNSSMILIATQYLATSYLGEILLPLANALHLTHTHNPNLTHNTSLVTTETGEAPNGQLHQYLRPTVGDTQALHIPWQGLYSLNMSIEWARSSCPDHSTTRFTKSSRVFKDDHVTYRHLITTMVIRSWWTIHIEWQLHLYVLICKPATSVWEQEILHWHAYRPISTTHSGLAKCACYHDCL